MPWLSQLSRADVKVAKPIPPPGDPPKRGTLSQNMRRGFRRGLGVLLRSSKQKYAAQVNVETPGNVGVDTSQSSSSTHTPGSKRHSSSSDHTPNSKRHGSCSDHTSSSSSPLRPAEDAEEPSGFETSPARGPPHFASSALPVVSSASQALMPCTVVTHSLARIRQGLEEQFSGDVPYSLEQSLIDLEQSIIEREHHLLSLLQMTEQQLHYYKGQGEEQRPEEFSNTSKDPLLLSQNVSSVPDINVTTSFLGISQASMQGPCYIDSSPVKRRSPEQIIQRFRAAVHAVQFTIVLANVHKYFCSHDLHRVRCNLLANIALKQPPAPWEFVVDILSSNEGTATVYSRDGCSAADDHLLGPELLERVITECEALTGSNSTRQQMEAHAHEHNVLSVLYSATAALGRIHPTTPLTWLREYFQCRFCGQRGALAPEWVRLMAGSSEVYWLDLATDSLQAHQPDEVGPCSDIWELSDAGAMQAVIRDLRRGQIEASDAVDWVQKRSMKDIRILNCALRQKGLEDGRWAGHLRDPNLEVLKEVAELVHAGHGLDEKILEDIGHVDVHTMRILTRVFTSFGQTTADKVDDAKLSGEEFVQLLTDLDLISDCFPECRKPWSLDTTLGDKLLRNHELTKKDVDLIFELTVAAIEDVQRRTGRRVSDGVKSIDFCGFLTALHMISRRMRRPFNDLLSDLTFSHLSPAYRPAFADMSNKGVMRRVRGVFRAFSGGDAKISAWQWKKLCKDCDLINKRFTVTDADSVFKAVAARHKARSHIDIDNAKELLHDVAIRMGCPTADIVGLVAWSFGPRLPVRKRSNAANNADEELINEMLDEPFVW